MLLWHGWQWGLGAGCVGCRLHRNTARPSRQQSGDHRALSLTEPRWWLGHHCGEGASVGLSYVIIRMLLFPPLQADGCPMFGHFHIAHILAVPHCIPHPLRSHMHLCLHTCPCLAVAVSPEYATLLMSGQGLWGQFRVTWFWVPEKEME